MKCDWKVTDYPRVNWLSLVRHLVDYSVPGTTHGDKGIITVLGWKLGCSIKDKIQRGTVRLIGHDRSFRLLSAKLLFTRNYSPSGNNITLIPGIIYLTNPNHDHCNGNIFVGTLEQSLLFEFIQL